MIDEKLLFKTSSDVRKYMIKNGKEDFRFDNGRILFNKTPSPDGAMGMFLLLKKSEFSIGDLSKREKEIMMILTFRSTLSEIKSKTGEGRIQDRFEEYTEQILNKKFPGEVKRTDRLHMDEYDFEVYPVRIEVKSDKWMYTGNVSLELLRDYRRYHLENVGSVIKTKSTFWQIYYYDSDGDLVLSEIYITSQLQNKTAEFLVSLSKSLGLKNI